MSSALVFSNVLGIFTFFEVLVYNIHPLKITYVKITLLCSRHLALYILKDQDPALHCGVYMHYYYFIKIKICKVK